MTVIMQTSKEMKNHLNHGALELCEIEQLLATALDRVQTAADEIRMCHDRADLVDSTVDALNREILTVNEEMDRVNSLRNNESDLYLRQENAHLKRDIAAMQQALRREMEEHKAQLTESVKSNEDLTRRIRKLEHFNELLKVRINEMKEKYESAIIDNLDLRDTVKSLQNTPGKHPPSSSPSLLPFNAFQLSTLLRTLHLQAMQTVAPLQDRPHLAKQWSRQIAASL